MIQRWNQRPVVRGDSGAPRGVVHLSVVVHTECGEGPGYRQRGETGTVACGNQAAQHSLEGVYCQDLGLRISLYTMCYKVCHVLACPLRKKVTSTCGSGDDTMQGLSLPFYIRVDKVSKGTTLMI